MSELVELCPSSFMDATPELVELSPSSLRGGLHDFLITYEALMCKLSVYPSCIPMCSTGEISSEMEEHLDARDILVSVVKWTLWTGMFLTLGLKIDTTTIRW